MTVSLDPLTHEQAIELLTEAFHVAADDFDGLDDAYEPFAIAGATGRLQARLAALCGLAQNLKQDPPRNRGEADDFWLDHEFLRVIARRVVSDGVADPLRRANLVVQLDRKLNEFFEFLLTLDTISPDFWPSIYEHLGVARLGPPPSTAAIERSARSEQPLLDPAPAAPRARLHQGDGSADDGPFRACPSCNTLKSEDSLTCPHCGKVDQTVIENHYLKTTAPGVGHLLLAWLAFSAWRYYLLGWASLPGNLRLAAIVAASLGMGALMFGSVSYFGVRSRKAGVVVLVVSLVAFAFLNAW